MTLKELKNKIAESENSEWYLNYQISLNYEHINFKLHLKGVPAIYEFILKQIEGFQQYEKLPQEFHKLKNRFAGLKDSILYLIANKDIHNHTWNSNLIPLTNNSPLVFPLDAPETAFLIRAFQEKPEYYDGAYEYMTGSLNHANNRPRWIGYMLAYEFISKDFSQVAERKETEKKSIASVRADFQNKLGEAETHLTEYLAHANQKFLDYSGKIDTLTGEMEKQFRDWYDKKTNEFQKFNQTSTKAVSELEELYKAKLKLEAPAKYWSDRSIKLRKEGYWWLVALVVCIGIASGVLIWVLGKTADGSLQKIFNETPTAIKWSVVLITLISFLAYGIRTFAKLTFSSFHLVRDSEEREQLTYVYLALQKEKGIDQTERHLIMQSLFSRADSGLLKDDSGPTMPGQILDQVSKK